MVDDDETPDDVKVRLSESTMNSCFELGTSSRTARISERHDERILG